MKTTINAALIVMTLGITANPLFAAGNIEAGKAKSVTCVACHGVDGRSTMPAVPGMVVPHIAGQYADYLEKSLQDYRSGKRKNASMSGMAAGLSDQDIADLASYYASLDGLKVVKRRP